MGTLIALLAIGAGSASGHGPTGHEAAAPGAAPAERPLRGMVYRELTPAAAGSLCEGGFEVEAKGPAICTHGPDPAPPGVDVRDFRSVPELRGAAPGADGQATPADTSGALVPCIGDGASGKRVQVIYARPADRPDRFAALKSLIATWAAQASSVFDDSAAQTGGSRLIRFVTQPSPDCELDIDSVTLSSTGDDTFGNTIDELHAAGYDRSDRTYMVFMDANVLCGIGQIWNDDQPGPGNANNGRPGVPGAIGRTDTACWGELDERNSTEAHELIHNLGGVQLSAPNSSGGWHCVDEYDTECYSDEPFFPPMQLVCPSFEERLLDCNDNDYFNTDPAPGSYLDTHWNVADSVFLTAEGGPVVPLNDDFAEAQPLSGVEVTRIGDRNSGATKEPGEPPHAGDPGGASVWYSWTAPASGPVAIDTAQSGFDTLLAVYTGSGVGSLAEVAANDDVAPGTDLTSQVSFEGVGGQTYRIAVDGFGGASGTLRLHVAGTGAPPPNDAFAAAQPLSGSEATRAGDTNRLATKEPGEPAHAGNSGGASVWYAWTAPADGPVAIDTAESDFDTTLAVYTGAGPGSLSEVSSNDDVVPGSDLTSKVAFLGAEGETYRIAVDGFKGEGDPEEGTVHLHLVGTEPAPPNDAFAAAQPLSGTSDLRLGDTNQQATKEPGEPAHAGNEGGASVWYSWTAPADGTVTVETAGSDFDTTLAAYVGGSVNLLAQVAFNDDVSGLRTSRIDFAATSGTTYRLAVDGYKGSEDAATGTIDLALQQGGSGPPNDSFSSPVQLLGIPASRSGDPNFGATKEPGEPAHAGNPGGASVWYSWTAPASGPVTVETVGSDFDTLLGVYVGTDVDSLGIVAANDDAQDGASRVAFTASAGQSYRIAVDGRNGGGGAARGIVTIAVYGEAAPPTVLPAFTFPAPSFSRSRARPQRPQTWILSGPRGRLRSRQATFRFGASQAAAFACRLDSRPWIRCASPKRYRNLAVGGHVFRVAARSISGAADPTAATRRFKVVLPHPLTR